jgi:DNA topoisomerase-1
VNLDTTPEILQSRGAPRAPAVERAPQRRSGASKAIEDAGRGAARAARLRYVHDDEPGIRRLGSPPRFRYVDATGHAIHGKAALARIRKLAIPPAWTSVWICPRPDGHIQATGKDARGRKQYRYHPAWSAHRDAHKYARMTAFGRALRRLRRSVERDLARKGLPREKVLAAIVRLLDLTHARIGNERYAKENRSYGLTIASEPTRARARTDRRHPVSRQER